ncbi:MAG: hypothetical protein QG596_2054 [Actinomycetota bacterium]|jgi:diguanylate cyclase (GGDEF)-like protein/PAS domain S-box-containing protein|nr:hypothetical protein [Actinomycetota bacterium]
METSEELLRQSEERHRLLAEHAMDVIWTMSPLGEITYVSPAVEAMRGITPEEAMKQSIEQIHPPDSQAVSLGYFERLDAQLQKGLPPEEFHGELEYYCSDGSTVWTEVQVIPHLAPDGSLIEILGVSRDISERRRHEKELEEARRQTEVANEALKQANEELTAMNGKLHLQAATDELTGCFNRRHVKQFLSAAAAKPEENEPVSLLMIDIDRFKDVNDSLGHGCGDQVLVELSQRIRSAIRTTDVLTRWGGDEFLVFMPFCEVEDACIIAEGLRLDVASKPFVGNAELTVSIGASQALPDESLEAWLAKTDSALYRAKQAGRNAVVKAKSRGEV